MSVTTTELDFDVVREPWNRYELAEGPILKTKYVLQGVRRTIKEDGQVGYDIKGQNIMVVSHVPIHMIGRKASREYSPEEVQSAIKNEDVRYNTLHEEWNEYIAEDGAKLRIKITVTGAASTTLFNKEGEPIYYIGTGTVVNVKPPKRI